MSITILNYHDQAFVDQINAEAAARAEAERAAAEAAKAQAAGSDFSSVLTNATDAYSGSTACSEDLSAIFDEAANTYGVSSRDILSKLKARGTECYYFPSFEEIEKFLLKNCVNGDLLITMGAGDIVNVGEDLLGK